MIRSLNTARLRAVMQSYDNRGIVMAMQHAHPLALYEGEGGGGTTPPPPPPPADKTYTQADLDREISGLRNKNQELLGKMKQANDRVAGLPDDATSDEIKEAISNQRKSKQEQLEAKGKYDELTRQMGDKHKEDTKKLEGTINTLTARIQTREKRLAATDAIRAAEGETKLLLPHIIEQLGVEEDGDDYNVFVVDKKGQPIVNANGAKMTVTELLAKMSEDTEYAAAFKAPDVKGSGARGGSGQQASNGDVILTNEAAKDVQTYRRARVQADKNGGTVLIRG